jgi:hypothetical protein
MPKINAYTFFAINVYAFIAINMYAFIFGMFFGFRFYLSVLQSCRSTSYAPLVKLAQHVHVYTYVEFVAGFGNGVSDASCSPPEQWAAWRVVELLVVAMPASASRRALRGTWRLAEVLLVAAPASASRRYPEWHAALVEALQ